MQSWYEPLIGKIEQTYSDLVIVADGDSLGQDAAVRRALEERFALHDYRGELPLRAFLDEKDTWQRAVIFKPANADYIPFDVENSACTVTWWLREVFPGLDFAVLKEFPARHYQKIYESYNAVRGSLGEAGAAETLHLICQWLFGINLAGVDNLTGAVALLAAFYREEGDLPPALRDYLESKKLELPKAIWANRDNFYRWLSEQWEVYLAAMVGAESPAVVDFAKPHLRELVAGLFMEGHLEPCRHPEYESFAQLLAANPWLQVGLVMEKSPPVAEECRLLLERIKRMLSADFANWPELAALWGRCNYFKDLEEVVLTEYDQVDAEMGQIFEIYINNHYDQLFYRSYRDHPATVDQVMRFLGSRPGVRKALLCLDGMGFQEWFCIREHLTGKGLTNFREGAVFALLPTITSVSRRALFCGQKEIAKLLPEEKGFVEHIDAYWWEGKSARKRVFLNAPLEWNSAYSDYDYIGLVFKGVDEVAHSRHLNKGGKRLLQLILEMHLAESNLAEVISNLLELGFRVYLTADHGIVNCRGSGHRADKYLADTRARRALLYPNRLLAEDFARGKDVLLCRQPGILGDNVLVVPRGREMFAPQGDTAVTHGGIHIEEIIVPFVEVLS